MFYFQRELVRGIDLYHKLPVLAPFQQIFSLWEVTFKNPLVNLANLTDRNVANYFDFFPSLPLNPSQDYEHFKQKRAEIESSGYEGIVVGSSRATHNGNLVVLFGDRSMNVQRIEPYPVEFRLLDVTGKDFHNHVTQVLDFTAEEVQFRVARLRQPEVSTLRGDGLILITDRVL